MKRYLIITICLFGLAVHAAYADFEAPDPSRTVPDGRVLAIGRAYTGLSEGTAAIFGNPAGLAKAQVWEFTSMSGKYLDEYNYLSFSGVYPTSYGNFGVGFMNSTVGGAFATVKDPNSSDQDPVYIIDITAPPISYFSNVTALSYANNLGRFFKRFGWEDRINVGLNLKIFQSGLTGGAITQGSASGNEVDLGIMYNPPWPFLTLGATLKNALPAALGGRLKYQSGHEESYPAVADLGLSLNLLGKQDAVRTWGANEVKLLFDYNFYPTRSGLPPTLHYGLEYKPIPMIALRFGVDQDVSGDGLGGVSAVNDLTGGVGLTVGGFSFNYAYRSFAGVSGLSNNFISLSYSPPIIVPEKVVKEPIKIVSPPDKLITFDASVSMEGIVNDGRIRYMTIADLAVKYGLKGDFIWNQELKIGKNPIIVAGFSTERKLLFSLKLRALRLTEFPDVTRDFWVAQPISLLAMENIITGYPDGTFRPDGNITRAEICSLLMKARDTSRGPSAEADTNLIELLPTLPTGFKDVSEKHWAAEYITQAAQLGVVNGYPHYFFKPNGKITRAEGVAMIARFASISEEATASGFRDLTPDHWATPIVAGARQAGLLLYLEDKLFEPKRLLTRA